MRVYHFVNEEHEIGNLRRKRLKIANLTELNDPFELFGVEMSNNQVRRAFEKMKRELSENRGILCFSEDWSNPVVWSHYANHHKGLCLGFEVPDECLGQVHYSRKRLVADLEKLSNPSSLALDEARKFLFTKYSHWRYEKEHRSFVTLEDKDPETGLYFVDFSDRLRLESVIVGARSTASRADIRSALGELATGVEVFKARLAFKKFKVVRQRKQQLWV
ncbi:DUF2971 domain-containing protein [Thiovibrio frasassiensis]|uniref:DUF2971 domain-containing protein n=1 Tax=Thiovibrio frasassiensis TaxID=2984131 RepID=A0A9X4RKX0_9BACT|nr:DUF2971 domain-containing protein [Thiovibrio frasassiensis]MDG4475044.1 DUF2971 domain-containing protein [Thiovibrio frasassiensis]